MVEQFCPVCGCTISDEAHEKEGVTYYCESLLQLGDSVSVIAGQSPKSKNSKI